MIIIVINNYFFEKEAIYMTIDDIINLSSDLTGFSPYGNIPYG